MTKETMTVHKALAELKILRTRINAALIDLKACGVKRHCDEMIDGMTIEDYEKNIRGNYDRARDLIRRFDAIKRAVTRSNSVTKIKIGGLEFTVAEAIDYRSNALPFFCSLHGKMAKGINECDTEIAAKNSGALVERADRYIEAIYSDKNSKVNSVEIDKARESFIKSNQYELVDPLDVRSESKKLEDLINNFDTEIDAALSVSNAITTVEIEY